MKKETRGAALAAVALALGAGTAFGYGAESLLGAWAYAEEPQAPVVVVDHQQVWQNVDGVWTPAVFHGQGDGEGNAGVGFWRLGTDEDNISHLWIPNGWWRTKWAKKGVAADAQSVFLVDAQTKGERCLRRMVKTEPPDWSQVLNVEDYCGNWRAESGLLLRVRRDECVLAVREDARFAEDRVVVKAWRRDGAALRLLQLDKRGVTDWRSFPLMNMWRDPSGCAWLYSSNHPFWIRAERTDADLPDPVERCVKLRREKDYHGIWGVSSEFNIFIMHFDRNGTGAITFFAGALPFNWTADDAGMVRCEIDRSLLPPDARTSDEIPDGFTCRYDPVANAMTLADVKDRDGKPRVLKHMRWESRVDEYLRQLQRMKENEERRRHVQAD